MILLIITATITACGSVSNPDTAIKVLLNKPGIHTRQVEIIAQSLSYFPNGTQFSIAFLDDSSTTYYGALRRHDSLLTIDNKRSVFEIGSLSKVFTSTLLADMVVHNQLQLDQPIQLYLDFPLNDSLPLTFKELSNHSSGLPRIPSGFIWESLWHMDNPYKDYNETKLRDYMRTEMEIEQEQTTPFQYSNIGVGILGFVLTEITKKSYEELLQERIFRPLNMRHSTTQRELVENMLVPGLDKRGNRTANWDLGALPGAGAVLSTAEDMAKFGAANFDTTNSVMRLQQLRTMSIDETMDMALGWFILKQDSTTQWHWHNGGTGGYRSSMNLHIDGKKGVVTLSNISAGHSQAARIDSLTFALLKSMEAIEQSPH